MNPTTFLNNQDLQNFHPINLLERLAERQANGCLEVCHNSVQWKLYFHQGLLTYATHSVEPFERLERHLRYLNRENPVLNATIRTEARLLFDGNSQSNEIFPPDYQAIAWLFNEKYLNGETVAILIKRLISEVLETYFLLNKFTFKFQENPTRSSYFCHFNIQHLGKEIQHKLLSWQALSPTISSPYQRLYFFGQNQTGQKLSSDQQQKFQKILRGFSFRQIAILVNQEELKIAQYLYPLIINKIVVLREPQPPLDLLPNLLVPQLNLEQVSEIGITLPQVVGNNDHFMAEEITTKTQQKIICIDDSPTILTEINRFLEGHNFSISTLTDSSKALMEIIRIKPDLILLDVGMPTIDGYKLCRLVRNHSLFKTTPIVMVTGNTGLVDRAKARVVGATDYLTKPFTQSELEKMVFRYLT
jgi:twitching motility two-component system response regulator PilG